MPTGQSAGRAGQDFFECVVGEPVLQAPGAFLLMPGKARGHALAEHILRPLP